MTPQTTPVRLNLKRDEKLEIDWQDGRKCVYTLSYLRALCPCAQCKLVREGQGAQGAQGVAGTAGGAGTGVQAGGAGRFGGADPQPPEQRKKKTSLTILPGNYAQPLTAVGAELVGNYALRIDWSDAHGSGIYSFQYLREICPA